MKRFIQHIIEKLYLIIMIGICLIPLVGLAWYHAPAANVEKRTLSAMPKPIVEGKPNITYLQDLGQYFEEHFAYRDYIVATDSVAMARLFQVSAVDTIVYGQKGWLYYQDSVKDYQCTDTLQKQGAIALAHNLRMIQNRVEADGRKFAFTVAPNKNSLYGDNMPDNLKYRSGRQRNIEVVQPLLQAQGINYVDLFQAFGAREDVLYRKQDSHWNGEGAVLAYNAILDSLDVKHETYEKSRWKKSKIKRGDLATSLYGIFADPEWDMEENEKDSYKFATDVNYWEEAPLVSTTNKKGKGSVYMYRDSFGITLGPLIANAFGTGFFSGESTYHLDNALKNNKTDVMIIEIVERNLRHFVDFDPADQSTGAPPIMTVRSTNLEKPQADKKLTKISSKPDHAVCNMQPDTAVIYGKIAADTISEDTQIFARISSGNTNRVYEGYLTVDPTTNKDYGYLVYVPKSELDQAENIQMVEMEGP